LIPLWVILFKWSYPGVLYGGSSIFPFGGGRTLFEFLVPSGKGRCDSLIAEASHCPTLVLNLPVEHRGRTLMFFLFFIFLL